MMAAIGAAQAGHQVFLYEKNEKLGKKIYITGKGRCNLTNASQPEEFFRNIVSNPKFMYSAYYTWDNQAIMQLMEDMGTPVKIERGNRVFPLSDKSSDVLLAFRKRLKQLQVKIYLNTEVSDICVENGKVMGIFLKEKEKIEADAVIVTTGGLSYPSTGSTGDGYRWAKERGHTIVSCRPSLVPLEIKEDFVKNLQGLSLKNVKVSLKDNHRQLYEGSGEMIFTHFGVSGPLILSASSYIKEIKKDKPLLLTLDLKPALSIEQLDQRILRDFKENQNKDFHHALKNLLPQKMIAYIIQLSQIPPHKKVNVITKEERARLVDNIKECQMTVTATRGYSEAIITKGGISIKEINPQTMESKLVKNLYFAGEILDLDALTGGYNLQIAWSTGYLAGTCI